MSTPTTDEVRAQVHAMWASVADRWAEYADEVDERGASVTEAMLTAAAVGDGDRVLELACGPGGAGLSAALRVGPTGHVVLSDVAAGMVEVAAQRAAQRGLLNVSTATLDLEQIADRDGIYDVVICRDGLMFAVEPLRALREIHRVLRPGGRVSLAVWGPRPDNPWLGALFDAVTAVTGFPVPPPGVPGPFSLGDATALQGLFVAAGFQGAVVERLDASLLVDSFEWWWRRTIAIAGPISAVLATLPAETLAALEDHLRVAFAPYTSATGLRIPGVALVASGRRD